MNTDATTNNVDSIRKIKDYDDENTELSNDTSKEDKQSKKSLLSPGSTVDDDDYEITSEMIELEKRKETEILELERNSTEFDKDLFYNPDLYIKKRLMDTFRDLHGGKTFTIIDRSPLWKIICGMFFLPPVVITLFLIYPQCDVHHLPDSKCWNEISWGYWIPTLILATTLGKTVQVVIEEIILNRILGCKTFTKVQTFFIFLGAILGAVSARLLLCYIFNTRVPPFSVFAELIGAFNVSFLFVFVILYNYYLKVLHVGYKEIKRLLFKSAEVIVVCTVGCMLWGVYVVYTLGYPILVQNKASNFIIFIYLTVVAFLIKEGAVRMLSWLWSHVYVEAYQIALTWVFLLHCTTLAILRGIAAGNLLHVCMLSVADLSSSFYNAFYITWFTLKQRYSTNSTSFAETFSDIVHADRHSFHHAKNEKFQERVSKAALHLSIEELIECSVPVVYLISSAIAYNIPNGKLVGGIGSDNFGYTQIEDIEEFTVSISLVALAEFVTFSLVTLLLKYKFAIYVYKDTVEFFQEYGSLHVTMTVLISLIFWATAFSHFGVDWTFQFVWIN